MMINARLPQIAQRRPAKALDSVPTDMLPMGDSAWTAYAGPNWLLSVKVGDGTVSRTEDQMSFHIPQGDATLKNDPAHPGHVIADLPNNQHGTGTLETTQKGFEAKLDDGRSVDIDRGGGHIDVHLHGFGNQDYVGVFLKRH